MASTDKMLNAMGLQPELKSVVQNSQNSLESQDSPQLQIECGPAINLKEAIRNSLMPKKKHELKK